MADEYPSRPPLSSPSCVNVCLGPVDFEADTLQSPSESESGNERRLWDLWDRDADEYVQEAAADVLRMFRDPWPWAAAQQGGACMNRA